MLQTRVKLNRVFFPRQLSEACNGSQQVQARLPLDQVIEVCHDPAQSSLCLLLLRLLTPVEGNCLRLQQASGISRSSDVSSYKNVRGGSLEIHTWFRCGFVGHACACMYVQLWRQLQASKFAHLGVVPNVHQPVAEISLVTSQLC